MTNQISLDGRVAIVTGAGNGLGRAHAIALAARGAAVVVNDVGGTVDGHGSSDAAGAVVDEITALGGRAVANRDSVARRSSADAMVTQALDQFGGLDIVVANAGIQRNNTYDAYDERDMHEMLDVHLKGSFWVTQAGYRIMKDRGYGRVVFTTSGSGLFGRGNSAGYTAAKAGIVGLMHGLALEGQSENVLVNAIAPIAYTRMNADDAVLGFADRMPPESASALVVYLASEQCSVTHEILEVALGRVARVFFGRTSGWRHDATTPPTPEDIAEHIPEIRDREQFIVPATAYADLEDLLGQAPGLAP